MSIKITGINSGMDTDAIIHELVSAKSQKKVKLEKQQTKLEWKTTAWAELNKKIKKFYSNTLSNFRFSTAFNKKKTTVSNPSIASVVASENAVKGSQTLVVKQLAKAGYLTGGKLGNGKSVNKGTKLSTLTDKLPGGAIGGDEAASFTVTVGGKKTKIDLTGSSSIEDVVNKLNNAGVNASFDSANQRIFVNVANSGTKNDFTLTADNINGLKALSGLGLLTKEELNQSLAQNQELASLYNNMTGGLDMDAAKSYVTEKATQYASALQKNTATAEKIQQMYDKIAELTEKWNSSDDKTAYEEALSKYGSKDAVAEQKKTVAEQREYLALLEKKNELGEDESLTEEETEKLAAFAEKYGEEPSFTTEDLDAQDAELTKAANAFTAYDSYQSAVTAQENSIKAAAKNAKILNDYYAEAYADQLSGVEGDTYAEKLASVQASITEAAANGEDTKALETLAGMLTKMADNESIYTGSVVTPDDIAYDAQKEGIQNRAIATVTQEAAAAYEAVNNADAYLAGTSDAVRILGQDAVIELNGAEFTSSSNTFSINGLTITATALSNVTGTDAAGNPIYEETTLNTENDVDGIYDMIKNFFKEYNELMKEIDTLYGADSAKDYEPLTDEEKEAMTDDEIEKWEKKIKDSLLRHDSDLGDVRNVLKESMLGSFTINGKKLSLADFGIFTQGYFDADDGERSLLHIDGNADDSVSSGNTDKLKKMIASDPDSVMKFFTQLSQGMYDKMQKLSRTSANRTYGNFYDDKVLASQYSDYKTKIARQQARINAMEDKYYKMFSRMEVQLAKMNSTSGYISSLFGGGQ